MTTYKKMIEDLENGCDEEWIEGENEYICGEEVEAPHFPSGGGILFCPNCRAKVSSAREARRLTLLEIKEKMNTIEYSPDSTDAYDKGFEDCLNEIKEFLASLSNDEVNHGN